MPIEYRGEICRTYEEYFRKKREWNNKRRKEATTEDPFKKFLAYDRAVMKQREHELRIKQLLEHSKYKQKKLF